MECRTGQTDRHVYDPALRRIDRPGSKSERRTEACRPARGVRKLGHCRFAGEKHRVSGFAVTPTPAGRSQRSANANTWRCSRMNHATATTKHDQPSRQQPLTPLRAIRLCDHPIDQLRRKHHAPKPPAGHHEYQPRMLAPSCEAIGGVMIACRRHKAANASQAAPACSSRYGGRQRRERQCASSIVTAAPRAGTGPSPAGPRVRSRAHTAARPRARRVKSCCGAPTNEQDRALALQG
jgi:hypothetical protein